MSLENVKELDFVALFEGGRLEKVQAGRTTKTRVMIGGRQFLRTTGLPLGEAHRSWAMHRTSAQAWEPRHEAQQLTLRAEHRLRQSRQKLSDVNWCGVTQEQANAVLAAMASAGMLNTPNAEAKRRPR